MGLPVLVGLALVLTTVSVVEKHPPKSVYLKSDKKSYSVAVQKTQKNEKELEASLKIFNLKQHDIQKIEMQGVPSRELLLSDEGETSLSITWMTTETEWYSGKRNNLPFVINVCLQNNKQFTIKTMYDTKLDKAVSISRVAALVLDNL